MLFYHVRARRGDAVRRGGEADPLVLAQVLLFGVKPLSTEISAVAEWEPRMPSSSSLHGIRRTKAHQGASIFRKVLRGARTSASPARQATLRGLVQENPMVPAALLGSLHVAEDLHEHHAGGAAPHGEQPRDEGYGVARSGLPQRRTHSKMTIICAEMPWCSLAAV